ncbi:uncharacterized protein LOC120353423 [Nilaparvata lugens]|uniref:uncharacterized protein LOC120353423 n=1 Tax=Nilaparvata lugens TaxID=108931 RepID=UPI00193D947D|nr:uncharacterized protein LOC120353423 [Nilaparvata lugens]
MPSPKITHSLCFILFVISASLCFELLGINTGQKGSLQWDINLKRVEKCKNPGTQQIVTDLRLKRISRTRIDLEGNITFKIDYGDNIKIVVDLSTWGNGGWKNNAYRFTIKRACNEFSVFEALLREIRRRTGMNSCPIRKGRYELKSLDTRILNNLSIPFYTIPTLWKLTFSHYLTAENKLLDCKMFIAESKVKQLNEHHADDE